MISYALTFIIGVAVGALITLNNTKKVQKIADSLEKEVKKLREKQKGIPPEV